MPEHGCDLGVGFTYFEQARHTFMPKVVKAQVINSQNLTCASERGADRVSSFCQLSLVDCRPQTHPSWPVGQVGCPKLVGPQQKLAKMRHIVSHGCR